MYRRKTWQEKMINPALPKVEAIPPKMQKRLGEGTMVLPSPRDVDQAMREIPEGTVTTVSRLRQSLAAKYSTDTACPLVTGIFVWVAANAAEEDTRSGSRVMTPYWRVVKDDGSLNPKFPGGVACQARRLRAEGIRIVGGKVQEPGLCQTGRNEPPPLPRIAHRRSSSLRQAG
jgi:6-O-methylguanine DNA methyltransferase, DNA binding domain